MLIFQIGDWIKVILAIVVMNLVAGFHALGTLMAVGIMMLQAAAARAHRRCWRVCGRLGLPRRLSCVPTAPAGALLGRGGAALAPKCPLCQSRRAVAALERASLTTPHRPGSVPGPTPRPGPSHRIVPHPPIPLPSRHAPARPPAGIAGRPATRVECI